jgi:hypothetical protein
VISNEWVGTFLVADGGVRTVTANDMRIGRPHEQTLANGAQTQRRVVAQQHDAADAATKEDVASVYQTALLIGIEKLSSTTLVGTVGVGDGPGGRVGVGQRKLHRPHGPDGAQP